MIVERRWNKQIGLYAFPDAYLPALPPRESSLLVKKTILFILSLLTMAVRRIRISMPLTAVSKDS